jgi:hypothetical protein
MAAQQYHEHKSPVFPVWIGLAVTATVAAGIGLIALLQPSAERITNTPAPPQNLIRIEHIPAGGGAAGSDDTRISEGAADEFDDEIRTQFEMRPDAQLVNGVEFTASNFVLRHSQLYANVCYQQPGMGVWDVNAATLDYRTGRTSNLAAHETYLYLASEAGQMGRRCLALEFEIPSEADLAHLTLTVHKIGMVAPAEGRECAVYTARLEQALAVRQMGITAECLQQPGGVQMRIVTRPESVSEAEAEALVGKAISGEIEGPWVFTDDLSE